MTEAEWISCADPMRMLMFLQGKVSERKLRLFAVACCRRIWHLLADERSRRMVEVAEQYADGLATISELFDPWPPFSTGQMPSVLAGASDTKAEASARDAARLAAARHTSTTGIGFFMRDVARYAAGAVAWRIVGTAKSATHAASWASAWNQTEADEYKMQVRLLRDIFGNPFRPVKVAPKWIAWNDRMVRRIAQSIYDERAFDRLPVLADALEEAGCGHEEILNHLRGTGPHVSGCWALDLVLGKE